MQLILNIMLFDYEIVVAVDDEKGEADRADMEKHRVRP